VVELPEQHRGVAATIGHPAYQRWSVVITESRDSAGLGGAITVGMIAGVDPSVRAAG
jgi:polyphosphate kinase 2 (PPK2 family)